MAWVGESFEKKRFQSFRDYWLLSASASSPLCIKMEKDDDEIPDWSTSDI
jgi:hypothetical protein